jgi:hypothetical protein
MSNAETLVYEFKTNIDFQKSKEKVVILWVDDHPSTSENYRHKLLFDRVSKLSNVAIYEETTTKKALEWIKKNSLLIKNNKTLFRIVTDMHRIEDGEEKPEAGLELIKKIEENNFLSYNIDYIKFFNSNVHIEEIECFLKGYPGNFFNKRSLFVIWKP